MSVWQKIKFWLLIGLLHAVYFAVRSSKMIKRIEIPRTKWGEKS